jgi:hypothetical protein
MFSTRKGLLFVGTGTFDFDDGWAVSQRDYFNAHHAGHILRTDAILGKLPENYILKIFIKSQRTHSGGIVLGLRFYAAGIRDRSY